MKIETVKTDAFHIDFFRFGRGQKALVILPGLSVQSVMLSADAIEEAYRSLAEDFTVYVFDRRRELPPAYTVDDMATDTAQAIFALGLGRVSIFGASQGAMMAMKVAANFPGLVEKLVLASAAQRIGGESAAILDRWIRLAKEENAEKLYLAFGETIYPRDLFEKLRDLLAEAAKSVTPEELRRFIILAEAAKNFDAEQELPGIACPTLVIGDTSDRVCGGGAAQAIFDRLKNCPGAQIHVYSGYGHACYDTAPDFKERILHFLI